MPDVFDSLIDRDDAGALIPEDASREIFESATESSAVMQLSRELPPMARGQRRLPVINHLPLAYFVSGDTGLKQTSRQAWKNVFINAEEIAVIVPIPEAVLEDADYDIWGEIRPHAAEAIGQRFDQAVLHGPKPESWPTALLTGATAAGHVVVEGSGDDLYDEVMAEGGVIALIEEDGFMATGHIAAMGLRAKLRGLRSKDAEQGSGVPLFTTDMRERQVYALDGETLVFPRNGGLDPAQASLVTGDWSQLVYAVRKDISAKVLDQAVITDDSEPPEIVFNLAQQDMVALRLTFRAGWALPNPKNRLAENDETRYPFAVLTPEGS